MVISREHGYDNHEGYPLVDCFVPGFRTEGRSSDINSDGDDY